MRAAFFALIAGSLPIGAYATGSFNGSSQGNVPLSRFTATIEATTFDGGIWVTNAGERVQVALGNPAAMKRRGLPLSALEIGKTVTVDAYDSPTDNSKTLYARRIVIDGRIVNLRT